MSSALQTFAASRRLNPKRNYVLVQLPQDLQSFKMIKRVQTQGSSPEMCFLSKVLLQPNRSKAGKSYQNVSYPQLWKLLLLKISVLTVVIVNLEGGISKKGLSRNINTNM